MKFNILTLLFLVLFYSGCVKNTHELNNGNLLFNTHKNPKSILDLNLNKNKITHNFDSCVMDAFSVTDRFEKYGEMMIESIDLDNTCVWNALGRSYFEELFKDKEKLEDMRLLKRFDLGNYEFSQYLINNKYKINLVYLWGVTTSLFVMDAKGDFSNQLLKNMGYEEQLQIDTPIYPLHKTYNLVEQNWYKNYFKIDKDSSQNDSIE